MIDKLKELRNIVMGGMIMTWDETTQKFNDFFSTTKTIQQLKGRYAKITHYKPSPNAWTDEQCKELFNEMEEPGTMNFKVLAKRLIFEKKDDKQLRNKTDQLWSKKNLFLSAAATKTSQATVDDFPTGDEPST